LGLFKNILDPAKPASFNIGFCRQCLPAGFGKAEADSSQIANG